MSDRFGNYHAQMAREHAKRRISERVGVEASDMLITAHELAIWNFDTEILGYGAERRELHEIEDDGQKYYAVWCPHMQCIVTYLGGPSEWKGGFLRKRA